MRGCESHPRREGPSRACLVFLKTNIVGEAILGTTSPVSSSIAWSYGLKGLCCLSQTSIRRHFRDYITSVQLLTFHTFPFWMSGCIFIWLYSASSMLRD